MSYISAFKKIIILTLLAILISVLSAGGQSSSFFGCGTIFYDSTCYYLDIEDLHDSIYIVDSVPELFIGQRVCVVGSLDPQCNPAPCSSSNGCITVDSIIFDNPNDTAYWTFCGVLMPGTNCLIFSQLWGGRLDTSQYLVLENYGEFEVFDTVCASGTLAIGPVDGCPEAGGQLLDNTIEPWIPPDIPYSNCGTLVMENGCMVFSPMDFPGEFYFLEFYGSFGLSDTVCVAGILINNCDWGCPGITACLANNTIYAWNNSGWPYEACGTIVQGYSCLLFSPFSDSATIYLALATADSAYSVGDSVCISGTIDWGCDFGCTEANGCLYNNYSVDRDSLFNQSLSIVMLQDGFHIDPILEAFGGLVLDSIPDENIYLVDFPQMYLLESIVGSVTNFPGVIFIQPNYTMGFPETFHSSQSFPDDQKPTLQEGISPVNYFGQNSAYTINIDSANILSQGEDVIVAVIDNGIEAEHPLFEGLILNEGYDFVDNDWDPAENPNGELYGHGTFVAGVIRRVAPDCKILPIRAFDENGLGNSYNIAKAVYYAIEKSADIINMSFGNYTNNPAVQEAINAAVQAEISLISACGNESINLATYPAVYPGVIAVSAIDSTEFLAEFSNYGDYLDVCAPGVDIYSSLAGTFNWGHWSGTSFAAPMVTGICALIKSEIDTMGAMAMEQAIRAGASRNLLWGTVIPPSNLYGYGKADAYRPVFNSRLGDVDGSHNCDLMDIAYLINALYKSGPNPVPLNKLGDIDCSGRINLLDITALIIYLYRNAPPPACID